MMTYAERQERARALCEALTRDVDSFTPDGITSWPELWEYVDAPGADFMEALSLWERTASNAARARVRDAYDRVVAAWKRAAHEYRRQTA